MNQEDRKRRWVASLALALAGSGCGGSQSVLDPAGEQAARIGSLFGLYLAVACVVFVLVTAYIVAAFVWRGRKQKTPVMLRPPAGPEARITRVVIGSVGLTVAVLVVLLIGDFATGRSIHAMADPKALTIRVTGHQWWWEFQYQDAEQSRMVTTANEVHIPVGRTVQFDLRSTDVIHSFWVPNLHGKRDMIPGQESHVFLKADRAGTYGGQCAEFCGYEHAFMKFRVVAEPEEDFQRWMDSQRRPAAEPQTDSRRRGRDVFLGTTCVMCHTIRGTAARSRVGPDLTHVASRAMIDGVLPHSRGNMAGWVVDPQRVKPGVRMPPNPIRPRDLDPLLDYLESLQ